MSREHALLLQKINTVIKETSRGVYPEDLVNRGLLSKSKAKQVFQELEEHHYLMSVNVNGANRYVINNIGEACMETYLDIKREI